VNISNLISVEAVRELGQILVDAVNLAMQNNNKQSKQPLMPVPIPKAKSNNKKKQQTPPPPPIPPPMEIIEHHQIEGGMPMPKAQLFNQRASPPQRREEMLIRTPPRAQFNNEPVLMVPETPPHENPIIAQTPQITILREGSKKGRKRHVNVTPSVWKICEEKQRMKELMKCEEKKLARKHRRLVFLFI
jgi:hypothetical protein